MGDELAGVLDEIGEQAELGRREPDILAADTCPVVVEIDDEIAVLEAARALRRWGRRTAERGLSLLMRRERLDRLRIVGERVESHARKA